MFGLKGSCYAPVHYSDCDDMINHRGSLSSDTSGLISCCNHRKTKHKIYKLLNVFVCTKKSPESPAKIISFFEIFCFERELLK